MNKGELLKLIEKGESEKVEFKETPKLDNSILTPFGEKRGRKYYLTVSAKYRQNMRMNKNKVGINEKINSGNGKISNKKYQELLCFKENCK